VTAIPSREKRAAPNLTPPSRAIRLQMRVATDPVRRTLGPMAMARIAAHGTLFPIACTAAAEWREAGGVEVGDLIVDLEFRPLVG